MSSCLRRPATVGAALAFAAAALTARAAVTYEDDPIRYTVTPPHDPTARLQARVAAREITLTWDDQFGYLPAVLTALKVPVSSQTLVFSKTSLQRDLISPQNPRALYFNDDVYVGFVPGGKVIEIASQDPHLGTVFYVLRQHQQDTPQFARAIHECLQCHDSQVMTGGVPGLMMRSVYPDRTGQPILTAGTFVTDQQSRFSERWGGWYVTGAHGRGRHMGNTTASEQNDTVTLDRERGANAKDAGAFIEANRYLGRGHSDLVALLVLTHQTQMHNLITRAAFDTRLALRDEAVINQMLHRRVGFRSDSTQARIHSTGEALVQHLLFTREAALPDPVAGSTAFAREFTSRGPRDGKGRSLRDLDLRRRLLRYPLSWLIYGAAFDELPAPMTAYVYRRLGEVLTGQDRTPPFAHLSPTDRRAILDILAATKPTLPAGWPRTP